jgi:MFS family permease
VSTIETEAPARPRAFDPVHRATTFGLLALVTMFAFEAVAVSLAMPSVARDLDGETLYPIAVVGLLTTAIIGMVVSAGWCDARGPSLPILVGGLGFTVGLLLSGFAPSMELFVAGRLAQGLGCGLAMTALYVVVADAFPAELRTRVFSLFATAWVVPSIAGPFVAGALVDLLGWRSVFLVVAAFSVVATLGVRAATGPRLTKRSGPLRWGRRPAYAVVAALGVLALHLAGHGHGVVAVAGVVAGLALVLWAVPSLLPTGTLRARAGLPAVIASRGIFGGAFACLELFVPLVLQRESGLSPTLAGLVMMVAALGWTGGSAWSGRHGRPETFAMLLRGGALALLVGSVVAVALVPLEHQPVPAALVALVALTVMAVGMGLATPLLSTLSLDLAEPERQGEAGAAIQMSDSLGQSVAAGVVGAVFAPWFLADQGTSYLAGFGVAVVLSLAAVAAAGRAVR